MNETIGFLQKSFGSGYGIPEEIWTTYSILSKQFFGVLFGADFSSSASYKITPSLLGWAEQVYSQTFLFYILLDECANLKKSLHSPKTSCETNPTNRYSG